MTQVADLVRFRRARTDLERFVVKNQGIDIDKLLDKLESGELMKQAQKCHFVLCQQDFIAERKDTIYCCVAHKVAAYRLRKSGYESTVLSDALLRAHEAELQSHGVAGSDAREAKRRREDALRAAYDALAAELGLAQAVEPDELQNEPENDATPDPVDAYRTRIKLRAFMAETGMGQSRIAKLAGVQQSTISLFLAEKTDGSSAFRTSIWDVISQDHGMDRR